jgi:hypothetical protein
MWSASNGFAHGPFQSVSLFVPQDAAFAQTWTGTYDARGCVAAAMCVDSKSTTSARFLGLAATQAVGLECVFGDGQDSGAASAPSVAMADGALVCSTAAGAFGQVRLRNASAGFDVAHVGSAASGPAAACLSVVGAACNAQQGLTVQLGGLGLQILAGNATCVGGERAGSQTCAFAFTTAESLSVTLRGSDGQMSLSAGTVSGLGLCGGPDASAAASAGSGMLARAAVAGIVAGLVLCLGLTLGLFVRHRSSRAKFVLPFRDPCVCSKTWLGDGSVMARTCAH